MPHGYEVIRDQFAKKMSLKAAKKKAAMIWNAKHKGAEAVGRYHEEFCDFMEGRWEKIRTDVATVKTKHGLAPEEPVSISLKKARKPEERKRAMWKVRVGRTDVSEDTGQVVGAGGNEGNEQGVGPASPTTSKDSKGVKLKYPKKPEEVVKPLANEEVMKTLTEFTEFMEEFLESKAHPGFKAVQNKVAKKYGKKAAGAIVAAASRKASSAAKAKNPKLRKVKG